MQTVAVIGLGNIGTIVAAHLVAAGQHRVTCCVHSAVKTLVVEGPYGTIQAQPDCIEEPSSATPADWVILAVKSQDTASAQPWLQKLCSSGTRVVVLQNGVDRHKQVQPYCSTCLIVPTVVMANGKRIGPHHIRHLSPGSDLILPDTEPGLRFSELFSGSSLIVKTSPHFEVDLWHKFLANIVANPLTAITRRSIEVVRGGEMEQLALGLLREALATAQACGVALPDDTAEQTLLWMSRFPGETGTSMLQDRLDGRALEYEALTGTVVRLGVEHGIPTPLNRAVCALLASMK